MWLILGAHDLGKQSEPLNMHVGITTNPVSVSAPPELSVCSHPQLKQFPVN